LNNVGLREDTVANENNLERGTGDKWRTIEKTRASWKKTHITCGKPLQEKQLGKREHAICSTNRENKSALTE
jgi:hypothetical protein